MTEVIAVTNQKGGVGKTTTAVSVAACLVELGRRVLLVDIDPQANATSGLAMRRPDPRESVYSALLEGRPLSEVVFPTRLGGLDLLPSHIALAGAEVELIDLPNRERLLRSGLERLGPEKYDYILIDCPPSLGLLTVNAVTAARWLLVPIQCEFYALEGIGLLSHTVSRLQRELNPELRIGGIVMTLFDGRLALAHQVVDEVRARFPDELLTPLIPRNVRLSEAPSHGLPVTLYDPTCRGTAAYRELSANLDRRLSGATEFAAAVP